MHRKNTPTNARSPIAVVDFIQLAKSRLPVQPRRAIGSRSLGLRRSGAEFLVAGEKMLPEERKN